MDHAWLFVLIAIPSAFLLAFVWAWLMRSSKIRGNTGTAKVYVSSVDESARTVNGSGDVEGQASGN